MIEWDKERKRIVFLEFIALAIMAGIILFGGVCDICVSKGIVLLEVDNISDISLTLLQIQATVTTLSITIITLLSGNISESYMGVSISKFFIEIKPYVMKQKWIIVCEFSLIVCSAIAHLFSLYNLVFAIGVISLGLIIISLLEVYEVFKGRKSINSKIEAYIRCVFEKESEYLPYAEDFLSEWKSVAFGQSYEEFEHYQDILNLLIKRILKKEKRIDDVNSFSENIARYLLEHSSENCKIKGLKYVEDYYGNLWIWINNNNEDALKIEKPISLLNRISSEWLSAFNSLDAEMIEEKLDFERLSEFVIRVASWIGYSSDNNSEVSTLNSLSRMLGGYINRQKEKGNLVNNKYWENLVRDRYGYFSYNITEQTKSFYLESLAKRDFNICYGYLLSGQVDFVLNAVFLDGIANTYTLDSSEFVFKNIMIHCYMYYLAFCETEACIDINLQEKIRALITRKDVIASIQNFIYRLSVNSKILDEDFEAKFEDTIEHYELFPKHSNGKTIIIDRIAREYFLYIVLLIERNSFNQDVVARLLDTDRYNQYLSDNSFKELRNRMLLMHPIFENEEINEQIIDDMLAVFVKIMSVKYKKKVLEEAAVCQREYESNEIQSNIENKIREELLSKIKDIYSNHIYSKSKSKTYNKLCVLNLIVPTKWIEDERRDTYADYAIGNFTSWLIKVLHKDFDFEIIDRKRFRSDSEFRDFLTNNKYSELMGSTYVFGCTEYSLHTEHNDFLDSQICKYVKMCNVGAAVINNAVSVNVVEVKVEVFSPELGDIELEKNNETGNYSYSIMQGLKLDFEEKEMREYLHDDQKIIRVTLDVEISLRDNEGQSSGVVVVRNSSI